MRACGPKHLGEAVTFCRDWCREASQEAGTWGMNGNDLDTGSSKRRYSMQQELRLSLRTQRPHTGEQSEKTSRNLGKAVKPEPRPWGAWRRCRSAPPAEKVSKRRGGWGALRPAAWEQTGSATVFAWRPRQGRAMVFKKHFVLRN